jgi:hypothetical protein
MLAAAALGELIADGAITADDGGLRVAEHRVVPTDPVGRHIYAELVRQPATYSVTDWLQFLAEDIGDRIGQRMVEQGLAVAETVGRFRRRTVYTPKNTTAAAWVYAGLAVAVREGHGLYGTDLFLLYLATCGSVRHQLLDSISQQCVDEAMTQLASLWPPWWSLLEQTAQAIEAAALTRH